MIGDIGNAIKRRMQCGFKEPLEQIAGTIMELSKIVIAGPTPKTADRGNPCLRFFCGISWNNCQDRSGWAWSVRFWVDRSTEIRPNYIEKPFCYSKLSTRLQWKYPLTGRLLAMQFCTPARAVSMNATQRVSSAVAISFSVTIRSPWNSFATRRITAMLVSLMVQTWGFHSCRHLTEGEVTWLKNRTHDYRPEVKSVTCMGSTQSDSPAWRKIRKNRNCPSKCWI